MQVITKLYGTATKLLKSRNKQFVRKYIKTSATHINTSFLIKMHSDNSAFIILAS